MVEQGPVRPMVGSSILSLIATILLSCNMAVVPEKGHCDITKYVDECEAAGLPHDVGVSWGCWHTTKPVGHKDVHLIRCIDQGSYKCCEAEPVD